MSGCQPFPVSTLRTPRIEDGTTIKLGSEMLNPQFNDYVEDSVGSHIDFLKSSCAIIEVSQGKETFIGWPINTKIRYEVGSSCHFLYPHQKRNVGGYMEEQSTQSSLFEDLYCNNCTHYKVQYKNVALCYKFGFPSFFQSFSIIVAPDFKDKAFIPYFAGAISGGPIRTTGIYEEVSTSFTGSLGIELSIRENLKVLSEMSYAYFPLYDSLGTKSSYPIFGVATTYNFSK